MTLAFEAVLVTIVVMVAIHYVVDEVRDRRAWRAEVRRRMGAQR